MPDVENQQLEQQLAALKKEYQYITNSEAWYWAMIYWSFRDRIWPIVSDNYYATQINALETLPVEDQIKFFESQLEILRNSRALSILRPPLESVTFVIRPLRRLAGRLYAKLKNQIPAHQRRHIQLILEKGLTYVSRPSPRFSTAGSSLPRPGKYDIICFSVIDWDFRFQRPQQLLTRFAYHEHRVFYVSLQFNSLRATQTISFEEKAPFVYELHLPGYINQIPYLDSLDHKVLKACLNSFATFNQTHSLIEAVCLVHLPFWEPLAQALRHRYGWKIIYDCMDDHSGFSTNSRKMTELEQNMAASSDLVVVTARKLYKKLQPVQSLLIPNGTDYDHFNHLPPKGKLSQFSGPVVGYYGAISDWFDAASVAYAAAQKPDWSFVLIGHTFDSDQATLTAQPNIHLLGEMPYQGLPAYLADFDVCIIPFLRTPLTEATNPVKFFEYLSSGKPVVATKLPELEPFADIAYLYQTKEEFLARLEQALAEQDSTISQKRQIVAQANTWESRYQSLSEAIQSLYGRASIIIISYNNLEYTRQCLASILTKTVYPNYEIIVVDNNSEEKVKTYLRRMNQQYSQIKVIFNEKNLGFAAANNIGLRQCPGSEFVVLLNNDVVVSRGWLTGLLKHLRDPKIGMVGPVTNWTGNEARIEVSYHQPKEMEPFAEAYTQVHEGQIFDIKSLAMYCLAMRREMFDEIGPLDEQFGLGMFEDDDYAMRVRQTGRRVVCAEDVFVHHFGRASFSKLEDEEYQGLFERNKHLYEAKWGKWVPHQYR
jgi:GT2 family glycosyltransferase